MLSWALRHERRALAADLRSEYQLDIRDLGSEELPIRDAAVLIDQLPRGSRLWKAIGGPMAVTEEWEALQHIEVGVRAIPWAFSDSKSRGKPPEPMPVPELNEKYRDMTSQSRRRESAEDYAVRKAQERRQRLEEMRAGKE